MSLFAPTNRRAFLTRIAAVAAATFAFPAFAQQGQSSGKTSDQNSSPAAAGGSDAATKGYPFSVPPLPYAYDALKDTIDEQTMRLHHDKHHQAYVDNLNKALKDHADLHGKSISELIRGLNSLPEAVQKDVRNQGGGHINHTMFWEIMTPGGAKEPGGELAEAIKTAFGSLDEMKTKFNEAGTKVFGSGWAWVVVDQSGKLAITSTPNQDNPLSAGQTPILGNDVWEHAYYLKYQNKRGDYLKAWWNVVNWDKVAELYAAAKKA